MLLLNKQLNNAAGVDTFNLLAKVDFIALKVKVVKSGIKELVNFLTDLNNLKTKVDQL